MSESWGKSPNLIGAQRHDRTQYRNDRSLFLWDHQSEAPNEMAKEVRFAVGSRDDVHSSVWRLWANKSELYLAARSSAGLSKISFHSSGICRWALVSSTPRPPIHSWRRQTEMKPGITPLFTIIVPALKLDEHLPDKLPPAHKPTVFVEPPDPGFKILVQLLLTKSTFAEVDFLKLPRQSPITFVGHVQLTHEIAWLIAYADHLAEHEQDWAEHLVRTTKIQLKPGGSKDDITFGQIHSLEMSLKPPAIVDLPVGRGNIEILPD